MENIIDNLELREDQKKVLENPLPFKAYPNEKTLDLHIKVYLLPFISSMLSLVDENSAKRLGVAVPAIKQNCWGMGFKEIVTMFVYYVDGKLDIEPISNYFDRIVLGKIVMAWNKYQDSLKSLDSSKKRQLTVQEKEKKEKETFYKINEEHFILESIIIFDMVMQGDEIETDCYWIYDFLEYRGLIEFTVKEKKAKMELAPEGEDRVKYAKRKLAEDYFKRLMVKEKHLKELL